MVMRPKSFLTAIALAALPGAPAAHALEVVASIKPVHALVSGVMAGVAAPHLLVEGAASPHGYSLKPSASRALQDAALVFWIGPGLERFMVKPLAALAADAQVVTLADAPGVMLLETRAAGLFAPSDAEEGDHAGHADEPEAPEEGHEHGAVDLHIWLDPGNAGAMIDAIAAALSEVDPVHAVTYAGNRERLRGDLADLDHRIATALYPVRDRPFLVFHDAYQYFARRYGLRELGAIALDPERPPGARRLQTLRARLHELGPACVFAEPSFEPALVEVIMAGTEARAGTLDPIGAALPEGPEHYLHLMQGLADGLTICLSRLSEP
jgi:zinc transport system substrate-binding protein